MTKPDQNKSDTNIQDKKIDSDIVVEEPSLLAAEKASFLSSLLERLMPSEEPEVIEWQDDSEHAIIEQEPIKTRALLYVIAFSLAVVLVWASIAEVNEVTRGEAKVIPSQQVQVVQSLDGVCSRKF